MTLDISSEPMEKFRETARRRMRAERRERERRRNRAMDPARRAARLPKEDFGAESMPLFDSPARGNRFDDRSDADRAVIGLDEGLYLRTLSRLPDLDPSIDVDPVELEGARPSSSTGSRRKGFAWETPCGAIGTDSPGTRGAGARGRAGGNLDGKGAPRRGRRIFGPGGVESSWVPYESGTDVRSFYSRFRRGNPRRSRSAQTSPSSNGGRYFRPSNPGDRTGNLSVSGRISVVSTHRPKCLSVSTPSASVSGTGRRAPIPPGVGFLRPGAFWRIHTRIGNVGNEGMIFPHG